MRAHNFSFRHCLLPGLLLLCLTLSLGCVKKNPAPADPALAEKSDDSQRFTAVVPAVGASAIHAYGAGQGQASSENLDDYDSTPTQSIADPLEPWNRFWFRFNDIFYLHIARPVYQGYTYVMPNEFQAGIRNFFFNILFPMRFVNALLQGKPEAAGVEFGRFLVNSTVGLGGFIDAAKGRKAVVQVDPDGEDLGQTFGVWGIGPGFYIVWPFLGPKNLRDSVGMVGDWAADPTFYIQPWYASWGAVIGLRFNNLGEVLPTYENIKDVAVDPYIAMREAYSSYRQIQIVR